MSPNYEVPAREVPPDDAGYFEKITQAVFQAGFSWAVIRNKWPNFRDAFANFDIEKVAAFTDEDIERLLENDGIVRNGRKIEATVHNARVCKQLIAKRGSFVGYLRTLDDLDYAARSKELVRQFKFMGAMGAYFFFYSVGEDVPEYEKWRAQQDAARK